MNSISGSRYVIVKPLLKMRLESRPLWEKLKGYRRLGLEALVPNSPSRCPRGTRGRPGKVSFASLSSS